MDSRGSDSQNYTYSRIVVTITTPNPRILRHKYHVFFRNRYNYVHTMVMKQIRTDGTFITVAQAASRLGISPRRVRALAEQGTLSVADIAQHSLLISNESVLAYRARPRSAGRPLSPRMAFASLYLIAGLPTTWITPQERYRIHTMLKSTDARHLSETVRMRATRTCFWAHHSDIQTIRRYIIPSGCTDQTAPTFQLESPSILEGYLSAAISASLMKRTFICENTSPTTLIIHTANFLPPHGDEMPLSVCAADLAQSPDPRESNAGLDMLDSLLHDFNRKDHHAVTSS